jgi:hypothetical protein
LFKYTKICILESSLRHFILHESHRGFLTVHFGHDTTLAMISNSYHFPKMQQYIQRLFKRCNTWTKSTTNPYGLYIPLPIPHAPWSAISIDFCQDSHASNMDMIWVFLYCGLFL